MAPALPPPATYDLTPTGTHLPPTTYHLASKGIELGVLLGGGAARSGGMLGIAARGGEQLGRKLG